MIPAAVNSVKERGIPFARKGFSLRRPPNRTDGQLRWTPLRRRVRGGKSVTYFDESRDNLPQNPLKDYTQKSSEVILRPGGFKNEGFHPPPGLPIPCLRDAAAPLRVRRQERLPRQFRSAPGPRAICRRAGSGHAAGETFRRIRVHPGGRRSRRRRIVAPRKPQLVPT
jgi:hypothetical protein